MSVIARAGRGAFIVVAVTGLVGCSGDGQSSSITETEISISAVEQEPDVPSARGSLVETNDDESLEEKADDDTLTGDESTEMADSEVTAGQPTSTILGPTSSVLATGSASTRSDGVVEESDSAPAPSNGGTAVADSSLSSVPAGNDAPASDSGSTSNQAGGSGNSNDVVDDDLGIDDSPPAGRANVSAPNGALFNLTDGTSTELADEVGGLTLIWFWSTDTPSSEREAAVVQRFAKTFDGSIGVVAVGSGGDRGQADDFLKTTDLGVKTLWSSNEDAAAHYQIDLLPTSLLIDGSGNIIGRWPGLPEEAFRLADRIS